MMTKAALDFLKSGMLKIIACMLLYLVFSIRFGTQSFWYKIAIIGKVFTEGVDEMSQECITQFRCRFACHVTHYFYEISKLGTLYTAKEVVLSRLRLYVMITD